MKTEIDKTYRLMSNAQDMVVGTNLDDLYFDYLYYQMRPLESPQFRDDEYDVNMEDLMELQKSAKAIIKMAKLSKEVKHIFG